jgi:hypothetical protein
MPCDGGVLALATLVFDDVALIERLMVPYRDRTSGWPAKQMDGEPGGTEGSTLAWLYMMFDEDRPAARWKHGAT